MTLHQVYSANPIFGIKYSVEDKPAELETQKVERKEDDVEIVDVRHHFFRPPHEAVALRHSPPSCFCLLNYRTSIMTLLLRITPMATKMSTGKQVCAARNTTIVTATTIQ